MKLRQAPLYVETRGTILPETISEEEGSMGSIHGEGSGWTCMKCMETISHGRGKTTRIQETRSLEDQERQVGEEDSEGTIMEAISDRFI